ncbi:MAG: nucleotide exchange factor GrpE [Candidatus Pacebacteria bacterium]|nr:nucleotide exchange factor GrpE [Candidatus Paceibacterota bacterium]
MSKKETKKISQKDQEKFDSAIKSEYTDDVEFTEEGSVGNDTIKKLRKKLADCQKEKQEHFDNLHRAKADFINARKDLHEQTKKEVSQAQGATIEELLPVIDSFDSAFANKDAWEKVDKNWRIGVEYIHSQFLDILKNSGLSVVDPTGEVFDPSLHVSVEMVETDDPKKEDRVAEIVQMGYQIENRMIRLPKVKVFSYKSSKEGK